MILFSPLERLLRGISITIIIICSIVYILRGREKSKSNEKILLDGFGIFILSVAISNLLLFFLDYFMPGSYLNHNYIFSFPDSSSSFTISFEEEIFSRFSGLISALGITTVIFSLEKTIKRTRYILTFINLIMVVSVFLPSFLFTSIYNNIFFADTFIVVIILYHLTKWSEKEFKAIASFLLLGFIFWINANFINIYSGLDLISILVPPIFYLLGAIYMMAPLLINQELFAYTMRYRKNLGIIALIANLYPVVFSIYYWLPLNFTLPIISLNLLFIYIYYKIIKNLKNPEEQGPDAQSPDVLGLFARPQKLTEEEVSVAKEKQICLVCKNKLGGNIFLCSSCGAFYCSKCSDTLAGMENACWVCESPFDESKPVNLEEKKGKEIEIDEGDLKKLKQARRLT